MDPLLSIGIPTRNRPKYVISSIKSAIRLPDQDLEVVVHDNSDSDALRSAVAELQDRRIRYHHTNRKLSMTENYDITVSMCRGRYISLIGDDDGVTKFLPIVARWADRNGVELTVPVNTAHYIWPDLQLVASNALRPGELKIQMPSGRITKFDGGVELDKCFKSAGQTFAGLPKSYYGIVARPAFMRVKERTGTFFPGISPDMASAVSLALVSPVVHHVDIPCFVPGSSAQSNAGRSGTNKHIGRLEDQPHLSAQELQQWSPSVPAFFSVPTIWAEACVGAVTRMGRPDLLSHFNFARLYAELLTYFPAYRRITCRQFRNTFKPAQKSGAFSWPRLAAELCRLASLRGYFLFRRIFYPVRRQNTTLGPLENVLEACLAVEATVEELQLCWNKT